MTQHDDTIEGEFLVKHIDTGEEGIKRPPNNSTPPLQLSDWKRIVDRIAPNLTNFLKLACQDCESFTGLLF